MRLLFTAAVTALAHAPTSNKTHLHAAMAQHRKQGALVKDLLLGFEPVQRYVDCIQGRFGAVATICADLQGGAVIGIKWRSAVSHSSAMREGRCVATIMLMHTGP